MKSTKPCAVGEAESRKIKYKLAACAAQEEKEEPCTALGTTLRGARGRIAASWVARGSDRKAAGATLGETERIGSKAALRRKQKEAACGQLQGSCSFGRGEIAALGSAQEEQRAERSASERRDRRE
ncbi:hypothetical protein C1H46_030720 [Malus baccata]|uniref:Uncharacterized protein n=1 Tax=Malus baccata TaxID=106549 RepID=A0A540LB90_MALBA|nr:hypothetical protein C1H46_030720 [Malus baccata]